MFGCFKQKLFEQLKLLMFISGFELYAQPEFGEALINFKRFELNLITEFELIFFQWISSKKFSV